MHALPQETFKTTNKKDEKRTFPCRVIVKMLRVQGEKGYTKRSKSHIKTRP